MGVAIPLQAFWGGGCYLSCPRMEEPEMSAADSSSTGLTFKHGERAKVVSTLGWCPQKSSQTPALSLPACCGLGEGRVKLQVSAKQVLSEKASQATQMLASPLPPPLSISLICPGQEQGISPPRLMRTRAGDRRKPVLTVCRAWGGHGRGVRAAEWPL